MHLEMADGNRSLDGLAAERTALAWRRTAASACAVAALLAHYALVVHRIPDAVAALVAASLGLALSIAAWRRNHLLRKGFRRPATVVIPIVAVASALVAAAFALAVGSGVGS
ncbi:DUF202 domain-containing protein [Nocardia sp. NPDC059091]|uniref:DUF202 domain-containing protein n=1 Tax=unclassified Nocardia TaxID=2637762 RepID=UPI003691E61C